MAAPDYSIGFTREEVEEILAAQKAELKRTLAAWSESGSSVTKRRIDEIHAIIAACQAALRKLAPEVYGRRRSCRHERGHRVSAQMNPLRSIITRILPKAWFSPYEAANHFAAARACAGCGPARRQARSSAGHAARTGAALALPAQELRLRARAGRQHGDLRDRRRHQAAGAFAQPGLEQGRRGILRALGRALRSHQPLLLRRVPGARVPGHGRGRRIFRPQDAQRGCRCRDFNSSSRTASTTATATTPTTASASMPTVRPASTACSSTTGISATCRRASCSTSSSRRARARCGTPRPCSTRSTTSSTRWSCSPWRSTP